MSKKNLPKNSVEITEWKQKQMLNAMQVSDELATGKQLWWLNKFCHDNSLDYPLPLSKYHAAMLINMLKVDEEIMEQHDITPELLLEIKSHILEHVGEAI